jgi:hypothetical protein
MNIEYEYKGMRIENHYCQVAVFSELRFAIFLNCLIPSKSHMVKSSFGYFYTPE